MAQEQRVDQRRGLHHVGRSDQPQVLLVLGLRSVETEISKLCRQDRIPKRVDAQHHDVVVHLHLGEPRGDNSRLHFHIIDDGADALLCPFSDRCLDVRQVDGLRTDEAVVLHGVHVILPEYQDTPDEVVRLHVVDAADARHALLDLERRVFRTCHDVVPLGDRCLRVRDRKVAPLRHVLRIVFRSGWHAFYFALYHIPQVVEGRMVERRDRFFQRVEIVPFALVLDVEVIDEDAVVRVVVTQDVRVLGFLVVEYSVTDAAVCRDGDDSIMRHLAETGLQGVHVRGRFVLVLLVVDDAASPLRVLVLQACGVQPEHAVRLQPGDAFRSRFEVRRQHSRELRVDRVFDDVAEIRDRGHRLVFTVRDEVDVVAFYSVNRAEEVKSEEVDEAVLP